MQGSPQIQSGVPHGDHRPHYGGLVMMKGDLHFEVVLSATGTHHVYFSDAVRAELPASVASELTLTISGPAMHAETLRASVDETGESWVAHGSPFKGADIVARVAFVVDGEPYWIDIPYVPASQPSRTVDAMAADYVGLVRSLGALDPESVDDAQRLAITSGSASRTPSLKEIHARAAALANELDATTPSEPRERGRIDALRRELVALAARAERLELHAPSSFASEYAMFFHRLPQPSANGARPDAVRARLNRALPGTGSLAERLARYEAGFVVGRGALDTTLRAAIEACRRRTLREIELPQDESVEIEYVAGKAWSGYSSYAGNHRSRLQISREWPLPIGEILDLACHEGYPGHHVYNVWRDRQLASRGLVEYSVLPVFGPQSVRAEVFATVAGALAFTHEERVALFRDTLFPLARLDPGEAERYVTVRDLVEALRPAIGDTLVAYLSGSTTASAASAALARNAAMAHPEATLAFADRYGAYALAYVVGQQLASHAAGAESRWSYLRKLLLLEATLDAGS